MKCRSVFAQELVRLFVLGCLVTAATTDALARPSESADQLGTEVGETERLSSRITELCTRLTPELDAFYGDLSRAAQGDLDSRLSILRPLWKQLSEREISVNRMRSEKTRLQGQLKAKALAIQALAQGRSSLAQVLNHRILMLSQNVVRSQAERVTAYRNEFFSIKRSPAETWDAFIDRRGELREKLDTETQLLQTLRGELVELESLLRRSQEIDLNALRTEHAQDEGRFNLAHGQLLGEEISLKSQRQKVSGYEKEMGRYISLPSLPPALPAICERIR